MLQHFLRRKWLLAEAEKDKGVTSNSVKQSGGENTPNIHDVARKADVAVGTVSRFLNGYNIRDGNRKRIEEAIEALQFRRNNAAAAIRKTHSQFVGFILPAFDEFHTEVLATVIQDMRQRGYVVLPYSDGAERLYLPDALDYFREHRVSALILSGDVGYHDHARELRELGIPLILYSNDMLGLEVDRVLVSDAKSAYRATQYLLEMGHTDIAILAGNMGDTTAQGRLEGFRKALSDAGIGEVQNTYVAGNGWNQSDGYFGMQSLLQCEKPPTAIFSSNYLLTLGAFQVFSEVGISVPDDVSVVTFGDSAHYPFYGNGLTAIDFPVQRIAASITDMFLSRISDGTVPLTRTMVHDCDLLVRGSVKPLVLADT